ncbi:MAG: class I tRNA ligase family protein, partial [Proteobacteria bacterium]|nr:class I tRNA ligase family protein [Pseudomonadota bacterium]
NAARDVGMSGCGPVDGFDPAGCALTVNRWIIGEVAATERRLTRAIDDYRFNDAANAIYQFTWHTFCDWYLEFTKPIIAGGDAAAQAETRAATAWVLDQLLHLLHPFMPFVTEELWEQLAPSGAPRATPLIAAPWPSYGDALGDAPAAAEMDWIVRLISSIRAVRAEMNVPAAARTGLLLKDATEATLARVEDHRDIISTLARVDAIAPLDGPVPEGSVQAVLDEATLVLPLAGVIDIAKEKARLEKEIEKIEGEIRKLEAKLGNQDFLAKAPQAVVEENRERLEEAKAALAKLKEALGRLAAG